MRLALHLAEGAVVTLCVFPLLRTRTRGRLRQSWSRRLLRALGVEIHARGGAIPRGCLLVANHVSWLDIFVINALTPSAFVAKSEVRRWPLIGWLAARNETLFLRRGERGHAGVVNSQIATLLQNDRTVVVFPEGTTSNGARVLRFHGALLQPAITSGHRIQPVALSYRTPAGVRSCAPAYAGDTSFGRCLARILATPRIIVQANVLEPVTDPAARPRRELAAHLHDTVAARIGGRGGPPTATIEEFEAGPSSACVQGASVS